ncbi:hypothetical protein [Blastococcus sp. CT_GayMR16]|uniref:hypothetical protein n=1 Tax=Blastococcus sp. CT_GayMR16 TaxID=2559607 RepID=UPI001074739F|nr:hypothetical protein [Blastococcus sp. CT_GayMR16]TFV90485.1 hypothetical protein E4P38_03410 [Blastococcus sp. CT_GayMR16]
MAKTGLIRALTVAGACVLAGCGSGSGEDTAATQTSAPASASASAAASAAPTATLTRHDEGALPDGWPAEASPEHGDEVWAVYLAVGPEGDPELAAATEYLRAQGYSTFEGRELGCDGGAAEALGRDRHELAVAAYFRWRPDAVDFLSLLKPPGSTAETSRGFVELLPVDWDCVA